jgi:hypoxanthine-guanine phosphoribosyltransferase
MIKPVILIDPEQIRHRVRAVAMELVQFEPQVIVTIPMAAMVFTADLMREPLLTALPVYNVSVKPWKGWGQAFEVVNAPRPFPYGAFSRALIVDSCLDSGDTLFRTKAYLHMMGATSIISAVAVDKNTTVCKTKCTASLIKMAREDSHEFLYGYGMDDVDGRWRGLPYVAYRPKAGEAAREHQD